MRLIIELPEGLEIDQNDAEEVLNVLMGYLEQFDCEIQDDVLRLKEPSYQTEG